MSAEELQAMVAWLEVALAAPERVRELTLKGHGIGTTPLGDRMIASLAIQAYANGAPAGPPGSNVVPVRTAVTIAALALEAGVAMGRGYEAYVRDSGELERLFKG